MLAASRRRRRSTRHTRHGWHARTESTTRCERAMRAGARAAAQRPPQLWGDQHGRPRRLPQLWVKRSTQNFRVRGGRLLTIFRAPTAELRSSAQAWPPAQTTRGAGALRLRQRVQRDPREGREIQVNLRLGVRCRGAWGLRPSTRRRCKASCGAGGSHFAFCQFGWRIRHPPTNAQ